MNLAKQRAVTALAIGNFGRRREAAGGGEFSAAVPLGAAATSGSSPPSRSRGRSGRSFCKLPELPKTEAAPFSWQGVVEPVFRLPITPRPVVIDKSHGGLSLEEPHMKNEKKTTKKIAIDRSKLLGFRLEEATGAAGGAKLGGKVGGKIGAKIGLKRRRTS